MRIYISGPIGTPVSGTTLESRRKAIYDMVERVREAGHEPVNPLLIDACSPIPDGACGVPVDADDPQSHSWACYMKYDIREMLLCDGVLALYKWAESAGANVEVTVAMLLNMNVWAQDSRGIVRLTQDPDKPEPLGLEDEGQDGNPIKQVGTTIL